MTPEQRATLDAILGLIAQGDGEALHDMAASVPADQAIVEIGAHRGLSTCWIALGADGGGGAHTWSIDLWPWSGPDEERVRGVRWAEEGAYEQWVENLHAVALKYGRVTPVRGAAVDVARTWTGPKVGMLFHDAGHSYEAVRDDYLAWLPHLASGAWVAVHDYWGQVPDGKGWWRRIGQSMRVIPEVILASGRWESVEAIGDPYDADSPNLWKGRRWS